jgi:lipopolysaccharide export system permease protein
MILRLLPGPFIGWLSMLMFLLLMQFLIRWLPQLVGRDLPFGVIAELVIYNLAYMLVLAVPMSVLIATLMTFGRLGETKAYAVMKGAGVSLLQVMWPVILVGLMLSGCMLYFNNEVLPEANFRARNLWLDIRAKKPGFELQPGVFYEGISKYSILVRGMPSPNELTDVIIFDYSDGPRNRVDIKAARGHLVPLDGGLFIDLILEDGQVDRLQNPTEARQEDRYERLSFKRHRLRLDLTDFVFERNDPSNSNSRRTDRTMRTAEMIRYVDSLEVEASAERAHLHELTVALFSDSLAQDPPEDAATPLPSPTPDTTAGPSPRIALAGLSTDQQKQAFDLAIQQTRRNRSQLENAERKIRYTLQRADRYRVEIHKKYSIAMACVVFMLIGIPLGLSIRRGGLGTAGALAIGIFLFFWVTLVQGEKLADRELLEPWIGMWIANILTGIIGVWLLLYVVFDVRSTLSLRRRLTGRRRKDMQANPPQAG